MCGFGQLELGFDPVLHPRPRPYGSGSGRRVRKNQTLSTDPYVIIRPTFRLTMMTRRSFPPDGPPYHLGPSSVDTRAKGGRRITTVPHYREFPVREPSGHPCSSHFDPELKLQCIVAGLHILASHASQNQSQLVSSAELADGMSGWYSRRARQGDAMMT